MHYYPELIQQVVRQAGVLDVSPIGEQAAAAVTAVASLTVAAAGRCEIIDIRAADEAELKPFVATDASITVRHIPFFKLATKFAELDPDITYLLYCEKGVMSQLQALYLQEQGYQNVAIYKP